LRKVRCPILAANGERDLQVSPKENLAEIEKALKAGGNSGHGGRRGRLARNSMPNTALTRQRLEASGAHYP
jgi:hypothetical protein